MDGRIPRFLTTGNVQPLDYHPCARCGLSVPYERKRANRADCETPEGTLVTYHKSCWRDEVEEEWLKEKVGRKTYGKTKTNKNDR